MGGKRNEEQCRLDNERGRERHRRQAEERAREREAEPPAHARGRPKSASPPSPATPKAVLRLERKVGSDGVARALGVVGRWRRACREAGAPTNDQDCIVYREALEMIALGLADDPPASPRETARSDAQFYDNREG